MDKCFYSS